MKMKILAVAILSALASGCMSNTYIENGASKGSDCESLTRLDKGVLYVSNICTEKETTENESAIYPSSPNRKRMH